jgi:teichoic acid transport system permease protein
MVRFQRDSCPVQLTARPVRRPVRPGRPRPAGRYCPARRWRIGRRAHTLPRLPRRLTVVTKQGRVSAPGQLSGPVTGGDSATATAEPENTLLPAGPLRDLAFQYGLKQTAVRPPLRGYAAELWQRRHFISGFATARNIAMYTEARLGQLWQVLTPLLNAGVYYLIFGLLLGTNRGVPDYISFLVTGIFVFNFTQRAFITSSQVIRDTLPLIRALYFPRACLPLGYVLIELQQLILSFAVLFVIVLIAGEPLTLYWLLIIPALILQTVFNVGCGLVLARWGAGFDDVSQLLPFIVRTWLYVSGVLFSLQALSLTVTGKLVHHPAIAYLLQINPAAVYITLIRYALLEKYRSSIPGTKPYNFRLCQTYRVFPGKDGHQTLSAYCHPNLPGIPELWLWGVGWAVVAVIIGFLFFWRAEAGYGRG